MKPSYIVNIRFYTSVSIVFSLTHSWSCPHAHIHAYAYYIFNLSKQLIVLQCKRVNSKNQNLNRSCDLIFWVRSMQSNFYSMRTIYYCSSFVIIIVEHIWSRNTTQEILHKFQQITVKHDTYKYLVNSPPRAAEESNSPSWFHFTEAGYSIAYFNHTYISAASIHKGSRFTFDKTSW